MNAMTGNITLDYPQILAEICAELTTLTQGRIEIGEDTDLLGDLGLDSLQVMNLHAADRGPVRHLHSGQHPARREDGPGSRDADRKPRA